MSSDNFYKNIWLMCSLSFISSVSVGVSLIFYAFFNDYLLYELASKASDLADAGLISTVFTNFIDGLQGNIVVLIPTIIDWLWCLAFIGFVYSFLSGAYYSKRENYFSFLKFTTVSIMVVLFAMGLFTTLSTWFNTEILLKLLPSLSYVTPFFSLYLDNIALVNMIIISVAIILNFVDLDLAAFRFRKDIDKNNQEIN